jgi:DHA1 family inner membrane transport protein
LGVPFGALVGERRGWRAAFWAVTGIGLLALAGIVLLVSGRAGQARPPMMAAPVPSGPGPPGGLRAQFRAFRSWQFAFGRNRGVRGLVVRG